MTEKELKQEEELIKAKESALNDAIKAYMIARVNEEETKQKYEEWIAKMQKTNFLAGVALGISIAVLLCNLASLFL